MALTKAEAQRISDLEEGIRMAKAMRWPEHYKPAAMTTAEIKSQLAPGGEHYGRAQMVARGWFANSYGEGTVSYGCSSGISHNSNGNTTSTQGVGRMFATEADAWRVVRYEMTERFARTLARVDEKIAELAP